MEEGDARAERAGERDGVADDLDREVGVVDGNEKMAVHGELLRLPEGSGRGRPALRRTLRSIRSGPVAGQLAGQIAAARSSLFFSSGTTKSTLILSPALILDRS